jgi:hypothetical protein
VHPLTACSRYSTDNHGKLFARLKVNIGWRVLKSQVKIPTISKQRHKSYQFHFF